MRIGLLNIATNKYIRFIPSLVWSSHTYFMQGHDVINVVLTDNEVFLKAHPYNLNAISVFPVKHLPWPGPTLYRYHWMLGIRDWLLENTDYLYYCDADMRFVGAVGDEILGDMVGTLHPGFWDKPRSYFTYETNPRSSACIEPWEGSRYYMGAFNGGRTHQFLNMAEVIKQQVDADARKGIVAVWHDESHLNRYFIDHPPTVTLDPGYCYPEPSPVPFTPRLMALGKDHLEIRSEQ